MLLDLCCLCESSKSQKIILTASAVSAPSGHQPLQASVNKLPAAPAAAPVGSAPVGSALAGHILQEPQQSQQSHCHTFALAEPATPSTPSCISSAQNSNTPSCFAVGEACTDSAEQGLETSKRCTGMFPRGVEVEGRIRQEAELRHTAAFLSSPPGVLFTDVSKFGGVFEGVPHDIAMLGITHTKSLRPIIDADFKEKALEHSGDSNRNAVRSMLSEAGIDFVCSKGRKPEPNQDTFFTACAGCFTLLCVADGHGRSGHWASHWAAKFLLRMLLEEITDLQMLPSDKTVMQMFDHAQKELVIASQAKEFDLWLSGTTLSIAVVDRSQQEVLMAWVGDSRCVLGRRSSQQGGTDYIRCSEDHRPNDPEEFDRISSSGGEVVQPLGDLAHRVFLKGTDSPGLAMSRSLGDLAGRSAGVSNEPGIRRFEFQKGDLLLCCTDGVWDFMSSEQALNQLISAGRENSGKALEMLVEDARDKWLDECAESSDDITAVSAWL
eukprot:TRINITY_DN6902_c0_g1_i1.p1 TRINITY_DN6902_c0_g1~~TRINITY_DN6902_c0_g1_i1.p1  ORF type:complete len:494 (-),score=84.86 TRINITY_DN6902_c0_g1_i1:40-1521(-)